MHPIPASPAEITSDWLTAVLRAAGCLRGGSVVACEATPLGADSGFASTIARLTLQYEGEHNAAPEQIIAKMAATSDDAARASMLADKFPREFHFYDQLQGDAGVRVPACYHCDYEPATGRLILLLEDLGDARFGDAGEGCSREDAAAVLRALAGLHARWWDEARLANFKWLPRFVATAEWFERFLARRETFIRRYREELSDEAVELTAAIGPRCLAAFQRLEGPPVTLLHVDTHLDNVAFLPGGDEPQAVLFDWQGASSGLCAVDVAAFLATAVGPAEIPSLLDGYHAALVGRGVNGYPREQLAADFRLACLRWWLGTVSGLGSSYAASWSGRQAELARDSVRRWQGVIRGQQLAELTA